MLITPTKVEKRNCTPDDICAVNLAGETIMWGVRSEGGNVYSGGTILDPKTNKQYKVKITDNGGTLTVRGYMGVSLLGRNQTWQRM